MELALCQLIVCRRTFVPYCKVPLGVTYGADSYVRNPTVV